MHAPEKEKKKKIYKWKVRGMQVDFRSEREGSAFRSLLLFSQSIITHLPPILGFIRQTTHTGDPLRPVRFRGCAECISTLRGDRADTLQHSLAGVTTEDGGVIDPLKGRVEIRIECVHGLRIDGGGWCDCGGFGRGRGMAFRECGRLGGT